MISHTAMALDFVKHNNAICVPAINGTVPKPCTETMELTAARSLVYFIDNNIYPFNSLTINTHKEMMSYLYTHAKELQ